LNILSSLEGLEPTLTMRPSKLLWNLRVAAPWAKWSQGCVFSGKFWPRGFWKQNPGLVPGWLVQAGGLEKKIDHLAYRCQNTILMTIMTTELFKMVYVAIGNQQRP